MSDFHCVVVRLPEPRKHENADRLEIFDVFGGYPCIATKGQFKARDLAAYIPIDALVDPTRPEFSFLVPAPKREAGMDDAAWTERRDRYQRDLGKKQRIKARKLRGVFSMGLLVPVPRGNKFAEGDNVQEHFGIEKYEPDESNKPARAGGSYDGGDIEGDSPLPYYDLEGFRRYSELFAEGQEVVLTEKVHGSQAVYYFSSQEKRLICASRSKIRRKPGTVTFARRARYLAQLVFHYVMCGAHFITPSRIWKLLRLWTPKRPQVPRPVKNNVWWQVATSLSLEQRLRACPDVAIYGEIYGPTQDLHYGSPTTPRFVAFDARDLKTMRWCEYDEFLILCHTLGIRTAPELYRGPWHPGLAALAEGKTTFDDVHVREGWVARQIPETVHPHFGRKILKLVGQGYLLRP